MDKQTYFDRLIERYERFYDVFYDLTDTDFDGFDLMASFALTSSKSFLSRDVKVQVIEEYEHAFVRLCEGEVGAAYIDELAQKVISFIDLLVEPNEYHKKSVMTCCIICENGCSPEAVQKVQKYRFKRSFKLQLWGWAELRIILVDLQANKVYHNVRGIIYRKQVEDFYDFLDEARVKLLNYKNRKKLR